MPDQVDPRSTAKPRPEAQYLGPVHKVHQRETADQRRARQTAAALTAQADLKREAAERRARAAR